MTLPSTEFRCDADSGDLFIADAVVIATGTQARWLGIESEQRLQGRGRVSLYDLRWFLLSWQERRGGQRQEYGGWRRRSTLTHHADSVTLIHRPRRAKRAEKILQARLFAHPKIKVIWNSIVDEIEGGGSPRWSPASGCAT